MEGKSLKLKMGLKIFLRHYIQNFFYIACYAKHPHNDIKQKMRLMKLLVGDISGLEDELTITNTTLHRHYDNGLMMSVN